jgi:hypothetical protein
MMFYSTQHILIFKSVIRKLHMLVKFPVDYEKDIKCKIQR